VIYIEHLKKSLDDCRDSIRLLLKKSGLMLKGIFKNGTREAHKYRNVTFLDLGQADIELFILVDSCEQRKDICFIRRNRYGYHIYIKNFPLYIIVHGHLFKLALMPSRIFYDVELLLRSHLQLAASTHLYYSEILYDTDDFLARIKREIMEKFPKKEYVRARLDFVYNLAHQKIREYLEEPAYRRRTLKSIWDGPIWALMSAGNLIITQQLLPPTFRRHLVMVRFLLEKLNMRHLYDELLEVWGFKNLSRKDVEEYYQKMKEAYDTLIKLGIEDCIINKTIRSFLFNGLKEMLDLGYILESVFPILRTFSRMDYVLRKRKIKARNIGLVSLKAGYELLESCGWDINSINEKIISIRSILDKFYVITLELLDHEEIKRNTNSRKQVM